MKEGTKLLLATLTLLLTPLINAVELNGTTFDVTGNPLNNTLINITVRNTNDFSIVGYNYTYSNATGWFNITLPNNPSWMFEPKLTHSNGVYIDYVGQTLPAFPSEIITEISGISFFLQEAGTINITAVDNTGARIAFNYQLKDQKLGYQIAGNMEEMGTSSTQEAIIHVPKNRNYSIMLFPNASMPATYGWTNFTSTNSYAFDNGFSNYNTTTRTVNKQFNMTMGYGRVHGYLNIPGIESLEAFTIIPYLVEPGNLVHAQYGTIPYNLSAFFAGENGTDIYNLSTGITNNPGYYNISLPSTVEFSELILMAVAKNGTNYYAGFHNLSLTYGTYTNGEGLMLNFSSMNGMLGAEGTIGLQDVTAGGQKTVPVRTQEFILVNETNRTINGLSAHIEVNVDYTDYAVKKFTWVTEVGQGATSNFTVPLLNTTGIEELNIFANGGNYAPLSISRTVNQIQTNNNITLRSFSPRDLSGTVGQGSSSIQISLYTSNNTCDVPNPAAGCNVGNTEGMDTFNPIKSIMGGGKLSFRMGVGGVLIHYVNVDLIASGPPDALFEDNSGVSETTSGGFGKAMRFGSNGPKIYDYVLISMPYTQGSSSTSGLNETAPVNFSIPVLQDENGNAIWNITTNGTNGTLLGNNHSHYQARANEWETLLEGTICTTNLSYFNETNPCYIDTTNNRIWARIPHFSEISGSAQGQSITATTTPSGSGSSGGSGGGGGGGSIFFEPSNTQLQEGYTVLLPLNYRVTMNIKGETHNLYILNFTEERINLRIASEPQTINIGINETQKIDVTNDGYYDLEVSIKEITYPRAKILLKTIQEQMPGTNNNEEQNTQNNNEQNTETNNENNKETTKTNKGLILTIILILLLIATLGFGYWKKKQTKHKKH